MVGQATAFAPNYNKAVLAAARVFRLLDRKPIIDAQGQSGLRLVSHSAVVKDKKVVEFILLYVNSHRSGLAQFGIFDRFF